MEHFNRAGINSILVIKPRAIGDVLLATPVLTNLRREFPWAQIDFLVETFAAPILDGNPYVDHVYSYDTERDSSVSVIKRVRANKYDLVLDLFANPRTAIITLFSGARTRVGFPFKWRRIAYNILIPPRSGEFHNVDFNLNALRHLGIRVEDSKPVFRVQPNSRVKAQEFLKRTGLTSKRFITINIGGGWQTKRWPAESFANLSGFVHDELSLDAVVLYGPAEKNDAQWICANSKAILAPPTTLHEMGAIMEESLLLVTNDSGPMHIAATLNVPTLAIFGPTSPRLQGPLGNISEIVRNEKLECLECNLTKCPIGNPCMKELDPQAVFSKLTNLLVRLDQHS